jgi:hypothetical protein
MCFSLVFKYYGIIMCKKDAHVKQTSMHHIMMLWQQDPNVLPTSHQKKNKSFATSFRN